MTKKTGIKNYLINGMSLCEQKKSNYLSMWLHKVRKVTIGRWQNRKTKHSYDDSIEHYKVRTITIETTKGDFMIHLFDDLR